MHHRMAGTERTNKGAVIWWGWAGVAGVAPRDRVVMTVELLDVAARHDHERRPPLSLALVDFTGRPAGNGAGSPAVPARTVNSSPSSAVNSTSCMCVHPVRCTSEVGAVVGQWACGGASRSRSRHLEIQRLRSDSSCCTRVSTCWCERRERGCLRRVWRGVRRRATRLLRRTRPSRGITIEVPTRDHPPGTRLSAPMSLRTTGHRSFDKIALRATTPMQRSIINAVQPTAVPLHLKISVHPGEEPRGLSPRA